jgi:hypothetical protein
VARETGGVSRAALPDPFRSSLYGPAPDLTPLAGLRAEARESPRRRRRVSTVLLAALSLIVALSLGRSLWDSVLDRLDWLAAVHPDRSRAESGVRREARPLAWIAYRAADGREVRALVDEQRLGEFLAGQVRQIDGRRQDLRQAARAGAGEASAPAFAAMTARLPAFSDWYLAWGTSYELLRVAAISAAGHAVSPGVMSLRDAVTQDVERHVEGRYRDLVLRPEESDPLLRAAYGQALSDAHRRTVAVAAQLDTDFLAFLARESQVLEDPVARSAPRLTLDWTTWTRKLAVPGMGDGAFEPLRGLALAAGGAMAGRAAGAAGGRALAQGISSRALAPTAAGLGSRLAAPAVSRLAAGVAGAGAGAAGGPLGLALGGAAGLGLDYLVHTAGAALQREEVEAAARGTLAAHARAWDQLLGDSVADAVDAWLDDLQAFLVEHAGQG